MEDGCIPADKSASIPTCAAVLVAALLAGCVPDDPHEGLPMKPVGYWGATQFLEERGTGCLYVINYKSRQTETPQPVIRPDGSHMGCKAVAS